MARATRGFGLIEVIASIGLMAIAVLSVGAVSIRMARSENVVRSKAAQVAAMRRAAAYWTSVPYAALPASGTQVCDTAVVVSSVRSCAAASTVVIGSASARRLLLTARVLEGAAVRPDTSVVDRVALTTTSPL